MKKIFLSILLVSSVFHLNAQITETPDGKVGIGTTTPEANIQIGSSTTNGLIMLGGGKGYSSIGSTRSDGGLILGKNVYARYLDATDNQIGRIGQTSTFGFSGIKLGQNGIIDFFGKSGNVTAGEIANEDQNSKLRINSDGNIGVGITSPKGKLEVRGTNAIWSDFKNYDGTTVNGFLPNGKKPTLIISETSSGTYIPATGGQITYKGGLSFGYGGAGIYSINPNPAGSGFYGELRFHTTYWNGSNYNNSDRMVIKLDGRVGIGTTSPSAKMHITDDGSSTDITLKLNNKFRFRGDGVLNWGSSSNHGLLSWDTNKTIIGALSNNDLSLHANNSEKMIIKADGTVGIGTNAPNGKLDLGGRVGAKRGLKIGDYIELNEREDINNAGVLGFNSVIDDQNISKFKPIWTGSSSSSGMIMSMASGGRSDLTFYGYDWGTDNTPRSLDEFTKVLHLSTKGQVSIGTTNTPSNYKLAVAGKIISEEITVKLQSAWPDYVFTNDYKLPTLKEVEQHIKEKGHLENIPSAKEVQENGIKLGEMNKKLLEKVEELTLYTIQQQKEIEELKGLVKQLINSKK
ncbi:hypothetical protein [Tenacibaculum amylolyticum]|uniref:hypothetical protein n=1 Tax=Tenacibaculum amylolyticum TaxID=104269 RepID=UPI003895221C